MSDWFKATLLFVAIVSAVAAISMGSWYAATHPWFATYVLLPSMMLAFLVCVWNACLAIVRLK